MGYNEKSSEPGTVRNNTLGLGNCIFYSFFRMVRTELSDKRQATILLVEGKRSNGFTFAEGLTKKGYKVALAQSGSEGIETLENLQPTAIVINAASLRTNGLRIVSRFHNKLPNCPIILIINENEELLEDPLANVVLRLPFTVQKLVNRLRTFKQTEDKHMLVCGKLQLNSQTNMVSYLDKEAHLTPRVARLLKLLMENAGDLITREDLFKTVWDTDYTGDTRTLDVHISWLRKALEQDPRDPKLILTERAVGYRLNL